VEGTFLTHTVGLLLNVQVLTLISVKSQLALILIHIFVQTMYSTAQ